MSTAVDHGVACVRPGVDAPRASTPEVPSLEAAGRLAGGWDQLAAPGIQPVGSAAGVRNGTQ